MKMIRTIMIVVALGLVAGAVYFILSPPPGEVGIVRYIPAGMMILFAVISFTVWIPMVSGLDHGKLLRTGVPATATIVAVDDTGSTVNQQPVFRFTLDVEHPDGTVKRLTTRQIVSRTSLGAIQPGIVVGVRVDPNRPDRVAIDSSRPAQLPSNPTIASVAAATAGTVMKTADIVRDGVRATATVKSSSLTGATFGGMAPGQADPSTADDPMVVLELQVTAPDGTGFESTGVHRVPNDRLPLLSPGATVPVAYLPRDPAGSTAIDWDRV